MNTPGFTAERALVRSVTPFAGRRGQLSIGPPSALQWGLPSQSPACHPAAPGHLGNAAGSRRPAPVKSRVCCKFVDGMRFAQPMRCVL
jgi:hypothetical protein